MYARLAGSSLFSPMLVLNSPPFSLNLASARIMYHHTRLRTALVNHHKSLFIQTTLFNFLLVDPLGEALCLQLALLLNADVSILETVPEPSAFLLLYYFLWQLGSSSKAMALIMLKSDPQTHTSPLPTQHISSFFFVDEPGAR